MSKRNGTFSVFQTVAPDISDAELGRRLRETAEFAALNNMERFEANLLEAARRIEQRRYASSFVSAMERVHRILGDRGDDLGGASADRLRELVRSVYGIMGNAIKDHKLLLESCDREARGEKS